MVTSLPFDSKVADLNPAVWNISIRRQGTSKVILAILMNKLILI